MWTERTKFTSPQLRVTRKIRLGCSGRGRKREGDWNCSAAIDSIIAVVCVCVCVCVCRTGTGLSCLVVSRLGLRSAKVHVRCCMTR